MTKFDKRQIELRRARGLPHNFGFPMAATAGGDLFMVPLLMDASNKNRITAELVTLDSLFPTVVPGETQIELLKIDTERYEFAELTGARGAAHGAAEVHPDRV